MNSQNLKQEMMNQYQATKKKNRHKDMSKIEVNGVMMNLLEAGRLIKGRILEYQGSRAKTCPECGSRKG